MTRAQAAVRLLVLAGLFPLFVFPFAGRWDWMMAWAVIGAMIIATLVSRILLVWKHPDLLDERANALDAENIKPWDRVMALAMAMTPLLVLVVAGLDERFGWSPPFGPGLQLAGLALVVAGYAFATWAMLANRYFSGVVRIQTERGHTVIDGGPYAIVRHPGYAGNLAAGIGFPLALSSFWALLPLLLVLGVTLARTSLEDQALQAELAGYADYSSRTRFRLIPGIW